MIKNAQANLSAVKQFSAAAIGAKDYSSRFDNGVNSLKQFERYIAQRTELVISSLAKLNSAKETVSSKIKEIKSLISDLNARINEMQGQIDSLESDLDALDEYIEINDVQVINPKYELIEGKICVLKTKLAAVRSDLSIQQRRLNSAEKIERSINAEIVHFQNVIDILKKYQSECSGCISKLIGLQSRNRQRCTVAVDGLKNIEKIISEYLRIKMNYDNAPVNIEQLNSFSAAGNRMGTKERSGSGNFLSESDPEEDDESYDDLDEYLSEMINGEQSDNLDLPRVVIVDNKQYGGEYNTYRDRLNGTPKDTNQLWGTYLGERGESMFVPAERTAEGIIVKRLLSEYGVDGINYINAEPEFEVCSVEIVEICDMTENREDYNDSDGIQRLGNFTQADIACAQLWRTQKKDGKDDWDARDVFEYRKSRNLTWHEKCDTKTVIMIRSEINAYFKHTGGCSECKKRDGIVDGGVFDE